MFLCVFSEVSTSDSEDLDEMERMRKDYIEALREIKKLQVKCMISVCINMHMPCAVLILFWIYRKEKLDVTKQLIYKDV